MVGLIFGWCLVGVFLTFATVAIISKKKRKKYGTYAVVSFVLLFVLPFVVEDFLFFKNDAKKLLSEDGIMLYNDFEITAHHITGMTDMYEEFNLKISNEDRDRIISELRHSPFVRDSAFAGNFGNTFRLAPTEKIYCDYESANDIERQTYQKEEGYISDWDIITVSKNDNKLVFQRINE